MGGRKEGILFTRGWLPCPLFPFDPFFWLEFISWYIVHNSGKEDVKITILWKQHFPIFCLVWGGVLLLFQDSGGMLLVTNSLALRSHLCAHNPYALAVSPKCRANSVPPDAGLAQDTHCFGPGQLCRLQPNSVFMCFQASDKWRTTSVWNAVWG